MNTDPLPDTPSDGEPQPSLWDELGIPEPVFDAEGTAPEVHQEILRRLVRGELSERNARAVLRLVFTYANWNEAHTRMLLEELGKERE